MEQPLEDQIYTLSDYSLEYAIEPFVAYPSSCEVSYSFELVVQEGENDTDLSVGDQKGIIESSGLISMDTATGTLTFESSDLALIDY